MTIEALDPRTKKVLWRTVMPAPARGEPAVLPPIATRLGRNVEVRCTFSNGLVVGELA